MSKPRAAKAWAIVNDEGVLFRQNQLLVYPTRRLADAARARLNIAADGDFDGRIQRVTIFPGRMVSLNADAAHEF